MFAHCYDVSNKWRNRITCSFSTFSWLLYYYIRSSYCMYIENNNNNNNINNNNNNNSFNNNNKVLMNDFNNNNNDNNKNNNNNNNNNNSSNKIQHIVQHIHLPLEFEDWRPEMDSYVNDIHMLCRYMRVCLCAWFYCVYQEINKIYNAHKQTQNPWNSYNTEKNKALIQNTHKQNIKLT